MAVAVRRHRAGAARTGVVVICIRARRSARHRPARAPQRLFRAAEFALVRSRRTRLEAMARSGDRLARFALRGLANIVRILSASQLGVTLASLGLGWIAESLLGDIVRGRRSAHLPFAIESRCASRSARAIALRRHLPARGVRRAGAQGRRAQSPGSARALARAAAARVRVDHYAVHRLPQQSSQRVLRLLGQRQGAIARKRALARGAATCSSSRAQEGGALEAHDADLLEAVFEFSEKNAREVMTPRTEIDALPTSTRRSTRCSSS